MWSGLRRRVTYANVVATAALVMATGGTAMAAVMITSNSQVAENTISGHAAPSGKHSNLIAGSVNATDLNASVTSSIKVHCPSGMQLGGDLCFEPTMRQNATFLHAATICSNLNRRLPDVGELTEILDHSSAPTLYEWSSNMTLDKFDSFEALLFGQDQSRTPIYESASTVDSGALEAYRCVATPTN